MAPTDSADLAVAVHCDTETSSRSRNNTLRNCSHSLVVCATPSRVGCVDRLVDPTKMCRSNFQFNLLLKSKLGFLKYKEKYSAYCACFICLVAYYVSTTVLDMHKVSFANLFVQVARSHRVSTLHVCVCNNGRWYKDLVLLPPSRHRCWVLI